ncbi:MAG: nitrilase-related carbon-nitrogen hydrolase, partial [Candidatus Melainabacteria bacterium]
MPNNSTSNLADNLTVALIQQTCSADKKENIAKTIELIRQAQLQGAELIVLQELHSTLYFCQTEDVTKFDLAETIPGNSAEIFAGIAKELKIVLVTSLFEKRAPGLYHNTSV